MTGTRGRALAIAAALLATGCASAHANDQSIVGPATSGHSSSQTTAANVPTAAQLAAQLLNEARVPPGSVQSATAPTKSLRTPPEGTKTVGSIVRYRWWRVAKSLAATYAWVAHHQSASVSSTGSSSSSGPALTDQESDADFAPPRLPSTVNSAQLSMAVAPLTPRLSAIGAFVVVVKQPPRPQIENVPATVDSVTVITRRNSGQPDGGSILGRTILTGDAARRLIADFDALTVQPPGEVFSCPFSFVTQTAAFRAAGHVWTATVGFCVGVDVNLDGRQLPTLDASNRFTRDLRAAFGRPFPSPLGNQPMTRTTKQTTTVNP